VGEIGARVVVGATGAGTVLGTVVATGGTVVVGDTVVGGVEPSPGAMNNEYTSKFGLPAPML